MDNKITRISDKFSKEMESIKEKRKEIHGEKDTFSHRKITSMIPKHLRWKEIKKDLILFKEGENKND